MLFNSKSRLTCTDFCEEPFFFIDNTTFQSIEISSTPIVPNQ